MPVTNSSVNCWWRLVSLIGLVYLQLSLKTSQSFTYSCQSRYFINSSNLWQLSVKKKDGENKHRSYLNINMKRTRRAKKVATLSMVRSITTSCLRSAGMKRTSFSILSRRKVRSTERPLAPPWASSTMLKYVKYSHVTEYVRYSHEIEYVRYLHVTEYVRYLHEMQCEVFT